jgi:hypothetical protein
VSHRLNTYQVTLLTEIGAIVAALAGGADRVHSLVSAFTGLLNAPKQTGN